MGEALRAASGQPQMGRGGLNGGTTMHHVETKYKKKKKRWYCHLGQPLTLCGASSQPITWHLYVTILWFILLRPIDTQHGGRGEWGCGWNADAPGYKLWSFGTASSTQQELGRGKNRKYRNGTCDIFVHLRNFCWDFWFCLYRECFATEKKEITPTATHSKIGKGQRKMLFFSSFFQCLL